jgi:hypothetical protein
MNSEASSSASASAPAPASLQVGKTKVELLKENTYSITTNDYISESLRENIEVLHKKNIKKTNNKNTSITEIELNAFSVMPLQSFLNKPENKKGVSYDVLLHFIGNIGNQLTYLKKKGYAVPFISLEDIIVIDDIIFAFINNEKVFKIEDVEGDGGDEDGEDERNERNERNNHNSKNIVIDFPIKFNKKNSFIPPMIKKYFHSSTLHSSDSQKLPIIIHHSWGFYSLAQLCIFIFLKKIINDDADYEDNAGPFIYTPFYWCLKRCLDKNNSKRILLYI